MNPDATYSSAKATSAKPAIMSILILSVRLMLTFRSIWLPLQLNAQAVAAPQKKPEAKA